MAVSKKARGLYWKVFDGVETGCANLINRIQERRLLKKYMTKKPIPSDFKRKHKEYWKRFVSGKAIREGVRFAWYYASQNGIFDPRYIPNTLIYTTIDQHFNDRKLGWGFNDKNYYSRIFAGIKQPKTLVRKIKGMLFNENYEQITVAEAQAVINAESEVVCKPTLETGSGRNIQFWITSEKQDEIKNFLLDNEQQDYIVQAVIKQHPALDLVHKSSLNTIRIATLLMGDGVHFLSSCLRMGTGGARVDNVTAGGISCGINKEGMIDEYAYTYYTGQKIDKHPQGLVFKGFYVPGYDKAIELIKRAHPMIGHFRLVSWDIAIDENGEAVLIEANMRNGGINLHQFSNGPLFGDLTEKVLCEVFHKQLEEL
ncbi:MAG: hypothetical protein E7421_01095 [Ruminococcaceae bacterium]|nr:hypothetical protein [Oscillospiraceae bacterium]